MKSAGLLETEMPAEDVLAAYAPSGAKSPDEDDVVIMFKQN